MPQIWEDAVKEIKKGSPGVNPYAAATAALQKAGDLKPGAREATAKGKRRGKHSKSWRDSHPPSREGRQMGGALSAPIQSQYLDQMDAGQSAGLAQQMAADASPHKRGGRVEGNAKRPHLGRARRKA
jgi:hypothetical protein